MRPGKKRLPLLVLALAAMTTACEGTEPPRTGFSADRLVFDLATATGPRPRVGFGYAAHEVSLSDEEVESLLSEETWFETPSGARIDPVVSVAAVDSVLVDADSRTVRIEPAKDLPEGWSRFVAGAALDEHFEIAFNPSSDPEVRRTMRLHRDSLPLPKVAMVVRDNQGAESLTFLFSEPVTIPEGTSIHDHLTVVDADGASLECQHRSSELLDDSEPLLQWTFACDPLPESFSIAGSADITSPEGLPVRLLDSSEPGFEIHLEPNANGFTSWRHP